MRIEIEYTIQDEDTPVQNFMRNYLGFIDFYDNFNEESEDMDVIFDMLIKHEKEVLKKFFVAGMFTKNRINSPSFDLDDYFDKFYHSAYPDE